MIEVLEGPWGSPLDLELQALDATRTTVHLERTAQRVWQSTDEPRPAAIDWLADDIAYLDPTRVTQADIDSRLESIQGASHLIVDVRGYPTSESWDLFPHLLAEPASSPQFMLPVTTRPDGAGRFFEDASWQEQPAAPRLAEEIVFLSNERALSAAETYLAVVKENHVGLIVGSPTAGTNGNVAQFVVPSGISIWMTALWVPGHGIGVQPDIPVHRTIAGVAAGTDELLQAAIQLLSD